MLDQEQRNRLLEGKIEKFSATYERNTAPFAILRDNLEMCWSNPAFYSENPIRSTVEKGLKEVVHLPEIVDCFQRGKAYSLRKGRTADGRYCLSPIMEKDELLGVLLWKNATVPKRSLSEEQLIAVSGMERYRREADFLVQTEFDKTYDLVMSFLDRDKDGNRKSLFEAGFQKIKAQMAKRERAEQNYGRLEKLKADRKEGENWEYVNITRQLQGLCDRLHRTAGEVHTEFTYSLPERLIAECPLDLLLNGILRLMANSLYFAQGGKVELKAEDLKKCLRVTVTDNGCGITPNRIKSILVPFYSYDPKICGPYECGLGLTLVQQWLETVGKGLHIVSDGVSGTTVSFELPYRIVSTPMISMTHPWEDDVFSREYELQMLPVTSCRDCVQP